MKRRWIIRSFFIGLLLLCVGGWMVSYKYDWTVLFTASNQWIMRSHWGKIDLIWEKHPVWPYRKGWHFWSAPADADAPDPSRFGFWASNYWGEENIIIVSFWFPMTISAAFLWLVWRKTRPPVRGRAFPVEAGTARSVDNAR